MEYAYLIFASFLILNLGIGLYYSRGIKTLKDYAIGNKTFPTFTVAATVVATWVTGSGFSIRLRNAFNGELVFDIVYILGAALTLALLGKLAIRMGEFYGSLSVAEAFGKIYGTKIRFITAVASLSWCIGRLASQFRIGSEIVEFAFGTDKTWVVVILVFWVVVYSALGGIRSIVFSDLVQSSIIILCLPIIAALVYLAVPPNVSIISSARTSGLSFGTLFEDESRFFLCSARFIRALLVGFCPPIFHRLLLKKSRVQIKKSVLRGCYLLYLYNALYNLP